MKQIIVRGYIRAFTESSFTVGDDFDPDDSETVQILWDEEALAGIGEDIIELLECSLDVVESEEPADPEPDPYREQIDLYEQSLVRFIRTVCAAELGKPYEYPFFSMSYWPGETPDQALLRMFRDERVLQTTDLHVVLVMCHG